MLNKIQDPADSSYTEPVILIDTDIEDAGIMESSDGAFNLIIMTFASLNGNEIRIKYRELKEILERMEEMM